AARGPAPATGARIPAAADRGRIMVATQEGYLALTDPDGAHYTRVTVRGLVPAGQIAPILAPDGRSLTTLGQVIAIGGGQPAAAQNTNVDLNMMSPANSGPFADHDRALVATDNFYGYGSATASIVVYDLAGGGHRALGTGDNVAGDPAAAGAFVSVAGPVQPSASVANPARNPDARVELRDAGRRPVVLATARTLSRVLGLDPSAAVDLVPYPDPAGDKVAVQVELVNGGGQTGGVVVLNRSGHVLGSVPPVSGPVVGQPLAWSPTGRALAFPGPSAGVGRPQLITWTVGAQPRSDAFPGASLRYGPCLWSPGESAILCSAFGQGGPQSERWVLASIQGGPMATVAARGTPLVWLPPAGGR
ncbi:MAG TPA: hypothetical protein VKD26_04360, partial [Streptosporangiaceae bacterium]|nr:hypothetical protein [Streptosporangiaceae bacterium]